ncbi:MAG: arylsulfatase [Opitutales bacterium]|nr:arylsulfatase [Opitutales bacterium]
MRKHLSISLALAAALFATAKSDQPNIIFILADDIGYNDLSMFGQTAFETPELDRMANEGIRFTDFYAGSAVCAPSRSVLLTGLHQGNTSIRANTMNIINEDGTPGATPKSFDPEDVTIGEVLKTVGYQTGIIGKWGLGELNDTGHPNKQGFDYFFGFLNHVHAHNHFTDHLYRNYERVDIPENEVIEVDCSYCHKFNFTGVVSTVREVYVDDLIRDESLAFIERNKKKPFFLYVSLISPHANNEAEQVDWAHGLEVPDYGPFENKDWPDTAKGYAEMMRRVDETAGAIRIKVEELGIADNTIIMFSGDNGPHQEGGNNPDFFDSNGALRGIKRDLYEGGIRMPTLAWGPGIVPQGVVSDHIAYFGDLMTTYAELAGAEAPENLDSLSFAPTLTGDFKKQEEPDYIYWEFYGHGSSQAVRMDQWKAVRIPLESGPIELYDLSKDLSEENDVAADHPELVAKIDKIMAANHHPSPSWIPDLGRKSPDRLRLEREAAKKK